MGKSSIVRKTIDSLVRRLLVATSVPASTTRSSSIGAVRRNVTGTRAADGGNSSTPISSRNVT